MSSYRGLITATLRSQSKRDGIADWADYVVEPEWLRSDNGPEFVASQVREWLKHSGIGSAFITPGSPWENGYVESFHASPRAEFLSRELFFSMREVSVMLEDWRHHYNHERPHGSLSNKPPVPKSTIASSPEKKKTNPQNSH